MTTADTAGAAKRRRARPSLGDRWLWPMRRFEDEFGVSDVQANYSRYYVWSANQLGHMTLGFVTALAFVWLIEAFFYGLKFSLRGLPTGEAGVAEYLGETPAAGAALEPLGALGYEPPPILQVLAARGMSFVAIALFVIIVLAVFKLFIERTFSPHQPKEGRIQRIVARCVLLAAFLSALTIVAWISLEALLRDVADIGAVLGPAIFLATLLFAAGAAVLSREPFLTALAWAGLAGAAVFAAPAAVTDTLSLAPPIKELLDAGALNLHGSPGMPLEFEQRRQAMVAIAIALLFVVIAALMTPRRKDRGLWLPFLATAFAGVFLYGFVGSLGDAPLYDARSVALSDEAYWRLAVAAAIASLAIWWTKEFGNDLFNVRAEISLARQSRADNGYPEAFDGVSRADDVAEAVEIYRKDAIWDSRTDALFYFAGAALAAGVLSPLGFTRADEWRSAFEFGAAILFIFFYFWLGYRWALRQVALDKMHPPNGSRLAVYGGALRLDAFRGGKPLRLGQGPMQALMNFAKPQAVLPKALAEKRIDHLIIAGRHGEGRLQLGLGAICEAALYSVPPAFVRQNRFFDPDRTARYVTLKNLLDGRPEVASRNEAAAHAANEASIVLIDNADVLSFDALQSLETLSGYERDAGDADRIRREVAQLRAAVIDTSLVSSVLGYALRRLNVGPGDQTIWIVNAPEGFERDADGAPRTPAGVENFRRELETALFERLQPQSPEDGPIVAVALAYRNDPDR